MKFNHSELSNALETHLLNVEDCNLLDYDVDGVLNNKVLGTVGFEAIDGHSSWEAEFEYNMVTKKVESIG
jgi:hypothetical protein